MQMCSHRVVAGAAELMARDLEFPWLVKRKSRFVDLPGNRPEAMVGTQEAQHVDGVGAGNAKPDRKASRDHDALGHKDKLLRNHAHGKQSAGVFGRPEIALDEFPMQVKSRRIEGHAAAKEMPYWQVHHVVASGNKGHADQRECRYEPDPLLHGIAGDSNEDLAELSTRIYHEMQWVFLNIEGGSRASPIVRERSNECK